mgnify:CR=1 FL=1
MLIRSVLFNFQGAFLNSVFLISQTTLLLYHIFSSLSRGFEKINGRKAEKIAFGTKNCEKGLTKAEKSSILYQSAWRDGWAGLRRTTGNRVFGKTFFKVFCDLFAFAVPSSRVLVYYITFTGKSQHFFEKFFSFVTYVLYI